MRQRGGDAYMGYAGRDEIVAALNALLAAERAGARVALASARNADPFYTITPPPDRLIFLNRGPSWMVRRLEALMPRVRDADLHADLRAMLDSHRENIARAEGYARQGQVRSTLSSSKVERGTPDIYGPPT
ncbi:DUF6306 domain-containing protein [Sphingomonas sp.]|uniref:DUF6306 domain-containing protein n=1 Tax=Sphingomonas sp. TaxID=28214 RepID=UPI00257E9C16|nr:DUF6306 domain-containing protein [Sphingomonas sp.]